MSLHQKAEEIAQELMGVASGIRESGEEVEMMFAFSCPGGNVEMLPAAMIPSADKDELTQKVRFLAEKIEAELVFTVCEAWLSMNLFGGPPSEDPARTEAILVSASGDGVSFMLTRHIQEDGTLGEIQTVTQGAGRFVNLSGREMMN